MYRDKIIRYLEEGLKPVDVAKILDCSIHTVYLYNRQLNKIKREKQHEPADTIRDHRTT